MNTMNIQMYLSDAQNEHLCNPFDYKMIAILVKTFLHSVRICFLMFCFCDERDAAKVKNIAKYKTKTDAAYILIQFIFV